MEEAIFNTLAGGLMGRTQKEKKSKSAKRATSGSVGSLDFFGTQSRGTKKKRGSKKSKKHAKSSRGNGSDLEARTGMKADDLASAKPDAAGSIDQNLRLFSASSQTELDEQARLSKDQLARTSKRALEAARARAAMEDEAAEALREQAGIRVKGTMPPRPIGSFDALEDGYIATGVAAQSNRGRADDAAAGATGASQRRCAAHLLRNIEAGEWVEPTPVQMQAVPSLLEGRDTLAIAPTGSGKTAAYLIPAVLSLGARAQGAGPRAVVLVPTRELQAQVLQEARRLSSGTGLRCGGLSRSAAAGAFGAEVEVQVQAGRGSGGASSESAATSGDEYKQQQDEDNEDEDEGEDENDDESEMGSEGKSKEGKGKQPPKGRDKRRSKSGTLLLSGAAREAARLRIPDVDILVATPLLLAWLARTEHGKHGLRSLRIVVLDECDRLLDGGSALSGQVDAVLSACGTGAARCLFSATIPGQVEELASHVLRDPLRITVGLKNAGAATISQRLVFVGQEKGKLLELRQMRATGLAPPVLIFVENKARAQELTEELLLDGWRAECLHSGLEPRTRKAVLQRFRDGSTWFLVATDVLGRGIDVPGIKMVVNFDFPPDVTAYVHRIGRTGRAGAKGEAVTFFTEADILRLRAVANVMRTNGCEVPEWMLQLRRMTKTEKRELRSGQAKGRRPVSAPTLWDQAQRRKAKKRKRAEREEEVKGRGGGEKEKEVAGGGASKGSTSSSRGSRGGAKERRRSKEGSEVGGKGVSEASRESKAKRRRKGTS